MALGKSPYLNNSLALSLCYSARAGFMYSKINKDDLKLLFPLVISLLLSNLLLLYIISLLREIFRKIRCSTYSLLVIYKQMPFWPKAWLILQSLFQDYSNRLREPTQLMPQLVHNYSFQYRRQLCYCNTKLHWDQFLLHYHSAKWLIRNSCFYRQHFPGSFLLLLDYQSYCLFFKVTNGSFILLLVRIQVKCLPIQDLDCFHPVIKDYQVIGPFYQSPC